MRLFGEDISISTITITILTVVTILVLSCSFYYSVMENQSATIVEVEHNPRRIQPASVNKLKKIVAESALAGIPTVVINFETPSNLPTSKEQGKCFSNSIAEPFRQDAWMCMVGNVIYDPCFGATQDAVFCQTNPLEDKAFLISITQPLPKASALQTVQNNWAWFVELVDGSYCAPFTGTRPFSQDKIAYYNCKSNTKGEKVVLLGDLIGGVVWHANKAIFVQNGGGWAVKSSEQIAVKKVWQ